MAKSEWSFKTAVETSAALAAKKVSAVELAQDVIGRIERHDGKVNAICVRDFERGLAAARAADAELAQGREEAAARHTHDGQGILQHGRPADDLRQSGLQGFHRQGRRAAGDARQGSRLRHPRQDQRADRARRLAELQRRLRHHQQSVRSRPHAGRIFRRIVGSARRRLWPALDRLRYRRLAARACVPLRRLRPQADLRPGCDARSSGAAGAAVAVQPRPQRDRADGARRGRSGFAAGRDGRPRSARYRRRLPARTAGGAADRTEEFSRAADRYRSGVADRQGGARHARAAWLRISPRPASRSTAAVRYCPTLPPRRGSTCEG